jgi:hypothetical protein
LCGTAVISFDQNKPAVFFVIPGLINAAKLDILVLSFQETG